MASLHIDASGASSIIQQLAPVGVTHVIRYGSNDSPDLTDNDLNKAIIVDCADNLYGLMQAAGYPQEEWGKILYASTELVNVLEEHAKTSQFIIRKGIAHNVEDYSGYAFPEYSGEYSETVKETIKDLENKANDLGRVNCRDMETAALFLCAEQRENFHVATVLQNVPKYQGNHQTYQTKSAQKAKELEKDFCDFIFKTLAEFADDYVPDFRSYIELSDKTIQGYLKSLGKMDGTDFDPEKISQVQEIGDGNLNNVWRVIDESGNHLIIKQALPYLRCVGEDYKLDKKRMYYEIRYAEHAKNLSLIPPIYYSDEKVMMTIVMKDLHEHQVLRAGLINQNRYPNLGRSVGEFLGNMLFKHSKLSLNFDEYQALVEEFSNNTLCKLTEGVVFTYPYMDFYENNHLEKMPFPLNDQILVNIKRLRESFQTQAQALLQGDLHTGSIMINRLEIFIIDHEFAFMGPMGFDLGLFIANILTSYASHYIQNHDQNYLRWLLKETLPDFINQFSDTFLQCWENHPKDPEDFVIKNNENYRKRYLDGIISTSIGFAGLEICRRVRGIAGVAEIRDLDPSTKEKVELFSWNIGKTLIEHYPSIIRVKTLIQEVEQVEKNFSEKTSSNGSGLTPFWALSNSENPNLNSNFLHNNKKRKIENSKTLETPSKK